MDNKKRYPRKMAEEPEETMMEEEQEGGVPIDIPVEEIPGSENWKDGETYNISMTVKQVSKGKFEILEAEEEEPDEESPEEEKGEGEVPEEE